MAVKHKIDPELMTVKGMVKVMFNIEETPADGAACDTHNGVGSSEAEEAQSRHTEQQ